MLRIQELNKAAFIWAITKEEPALEFDGHMASFGFSKVADASAALISYETGAVVEAKVFSRMRDSLFRRIRGTK
ncbi:MAG: hypothetical protein IPP74_15275 [Alphaproteobacteria bacterium]|nr:hypothetical protein [Alphaproteobacteria bacterium]